MNSDEFYIEEIRERLTPERFRHSLCVAVKAKDLAKRYGADPEKAYTAGILHDILKDTEKTVLREMIEADCPMTDVEINAPKLYHAMAGAKFIQTEYGITDRAIIDAVRYHTTGRRNMSLLEKVLFIADFVSEDRNYNGVERMRSKAEISLETAMEEGLQFTIQELAEALKPIHPDTLDAYNEILITNRKDS